MVVLLGAVAFVTDIGMAIVWTREAQAAADAGALAGAIDIPGTNGIPNDNVQAVSDATTIANQNLNQERLTGATVVAYSPPQTSQSHNGDVASVEVRITATSPPFFLRVLGVSPLQIKGHAVASSQGSVGTPPILVGDPSAPDSLDIGENPGESLSSRYQPSGGIDLAGGTGTGGAACNPGTLVDCTVVSVNGPIYTNSIADDGEEVHANDVLSATNNTPSGGNQGLCGSGETCGTYKPGPTSGNGTQVPDPLAYLTPPTYVNTNGAWTEPTHTGPKFCNPGAGGAPPSCVVTTASVPVTASPGVYNTLAIEGPGALTLTPGTYVITGSLQLTGTQSGSNTGTTPSRASLTGNGVTLYFACPSSTAPYWTDCPSGGGVSGFKGTPDTCTVNCCPNDCTGAATTSGCPNTCSPGGFFNIQTGKGSFNLTGSTNGPDQGVLFFMDRNNYVQRPGGVANETQETFNMEVINGSTNDVMAGTIYGKGSNFWIESPNTAASFSPDSCILVNSLGICGPANVTVSCASPSNAVPSKIPLWWSEPDRVDAHPNEREGGQRGAGNGKRRIERPDRTPQESKRTRRTGAIARRVRVHRAVARDHCSRVR